MTPCFFVASVWTGHALGEHCDLHAEATSSRSNVYVAALYEAARYRTVRYEGHFEGLSTETGWRSRALLVAAKLPAYRLVRNGSPAVGLGDLTLLAQQELWQRRSILDALGGRLGLSLPTGDAARDLGMGHMMVMPAAFARIRWSVLDVQMGLGLARAITLGQSHRHGHDIGYFPIVQPMNATEWNAMTSVRVAIAGGIQLRSRIDTAWPFGEAQGAKRAVLGFGATFVRRELSTYVDWQVPFAGTPFVFRWSAGISVPFAFGT